MKKRLCCFCISAAVLFGFLVLPAHAEKFTPSVTYKPAPSIIEQESGFDIKIFDEGETPLLDVPWGEIVVTPVSKVEDAKYEDIKTNLHYANDLITDAPSLYSVCTSLEEAVMFDHPEIAEDELIVKDLFHLALYGTYKDYLEQPGNHIYLTFETGVEEIEPFYVLFCTNGGTWNTLPADCVVRNGDGTVTVRFYSVGAVAFITAKPIEIDVDVNNPEHQSPQTGEVISEWEIAAVIAGLLMLSCLLCCSRAKKRRP